MNSIRSFITTSSFFLLADVIALGVLPFEAGVLSFCLKPESIAAGKVVPRSQMSMSFKILAYYRNIRE